MSISDHTQCENSPPVSPVGEKVDCLSSCVQGVVVLVLPDAGSNSQGASESSNSHEKLCMPNCHWSWTYWLSHSMEEDCFCAITVLWGGQVCWRQRQPVRLGKVHLSRFFPRTWSFGNVFFTLETKSTFPPNVSSSCSKHFTTCSLLEISRKINFQKFWRLSAIFKNENKQKCCRWRHNIQISRESVRHIVKV